MNPTADTFESMSTRAVHAGEPHHDGAVVMPIFQTANYLHAGTSDYHATRYVRLSNSPTHDALHAKLAALEEAEAALVASSGMAAISTALLGTLRAGDHFLCVEAPYGGTRTLVTDVLPRFGIEGTFVDGNAPDAWAAALRPETRVFYAESITNPLMRVPDLRGIAGFARAKDLVSIIDNTMASPVNFRPLAIGFDLVVHSATKYLNGHSDIAAGALMGGGELVHRLHHLLDHLGGALDPHACFLLHRGIKTMTLRVREQNETAAHVARALADHPAVATVNYPGLPGTQGHAHAKALFDGFGGMLSFELTGGKAGAERFTEKLAIPLHAASLGGVESLVIRPAVTAYANVDADDRRRLGISDGLIRMSVGIEDRAELIADLTRALDHVASEAVSA